MVTGAFLKLVPWQKHGHEQTHARYVLMVRADHRLWPAVLTR
jgi:hypothetical protein